MPDKPFKVLTQEEFQRLTIDERMAYNQRAMADLREKLEATRKQSEKMRAPEADC